MAAWWNAVDAVSRFNTLMQVLAVLFIILSAAATALSIKSTNRVSFLKDLEAKKLGASLEKTRESLQKSNAEREAAERTLNEQLQIARQSAEVAVQESAVAKQSAEAANLKAVEAQNKITPRHLTEDQKQKLFQLLRSGPKGPVEITSLLGDPESHSFALELDAIFNNAGWKTNGVNQGVFNGSPKGLILQIKSVQASPPNAGYLQKALAAIGYHASGELAEGLPEQKLALIVGQKP
jgi:DNA-binding transcriptional MerR regulator